MSAIFAPVRALTLATLLSTIASTLAASLEEWRSRSIYQVMTDRFALSPHTPWMPCETSIGPYCGGSWRGIQANLDYIQGLGADAVWISPVVANLPQYTKDGQAYAGYWQQDLFVLNENFGALEDLHALIQAVHDRDMLFMLDVVVNHMGYNSFNGSHTAIDYSVFKPFNDEKYYHPYCALDYSGDNLTSLEVCWLGSEHVPLVDLRTEDEEVQKVFGDWIEQMVSNYSVDGLRIDAGVNVEPDFFTDFVKSAGIFATAEVYHTNDSVVSKWEKTVGSTLNYPLYWPLTSAFQENGDFSDLVDMIESERKSFSDPLSLGIFSENQDVPRFANHTSDMSRAMNVAAFVIMYDGIPIIYQGQEQHFSGGTDPYTNREPLWEHGFDVFNPMYQHISTLNFLRKQAISNDNKYTTSLSSVSTPDNNTLLMAKGSKGKQVLTLLSNAGSGSDESTVVMDMSNTGYSSGTEMTEVLSCQTYTIASNNSLVFAMPAGGEPAVFYSSSALKGSTLCGTTGDRYASSVMTTITQTTYTSTVGSSATVMVSTATVPIVASEITSTAAATQSPSSSVALRSGNSLSAWSLVAMLAAANGILGVVMGGSW